MKTPKTKPNKFPLLLQLTSAFVGAALSLYLAIQHTKLKNGIQEGPSFCNWGEGFNCDAVTTSTWAEFGGVSLGVIGWAFYTLVFTLLLFFPDRFRSFAKVRHALSWLLSFALAVDVYLFIAQYLWIHHFCIVCIGTYLATVGVLKGLFWGAYRENNGDMSAALQAMYVGNPHENVLKKEKTDGSRWAFWFLMYLFVLGAGFFYDRGFVPSAIDKAEEMTPEAQSEAFKKLWEYAPRKDIPIASTDGTKGNKAAKVKLVVFSDFECPFCKRAAFMLGSTIESLGDRVQLVFKNFPLSSECNPELDRPMHPNACLLAHLGYCANKKGRFWKFHDRVFFEFSEEDVRAPVVKVEEKLADILSKKEIDECLKDPASKNNTHNDVELGRKLELQGTPAIFINGKQYQLPLTPESLRMAIEWEWSGG